MLNRGLDKLELLRIVEAVANEKSIDKELVIGYGFYFYGTGGFCSGLDMSINF